MNFPIIQINQSNQKASPFTFFIHASGENSGKPSFTPCGNAYIAICTGKLDMQYYYWLCYSYWQTGRFNKYIQHQPWPSVALDDVKYVLIPLIPAIYRHRFKY